MDIKLPNLYDFSSYKQYLEAVISMNTDRRGIKQVIARLLRCHRSLLSRILSSDEHVSLESANFFCESQNFTDEQSAYFIKLVLFERSEQRGLRNLFLKQIQETQKAKRQLKNQIIERGAAPSLEQNFYYQSWMPSAVHVMTSLKQQLSAAEIAELLSLHVEVVRSLLETLEKNLLVKRIGDKWQYVGQSIHLSKESAQYIPFYQSWSERSLVDLIRKQNESETVHFTSVLSVNAKSAEQIRNILYRAIGDIQKEVTASTAEDHVCCLKLDFFNVTQGA